MASSRSPGASSSWSISMSMDGRIAGFRLSGDFFLEPDDALADIDAAVNGLPVESEAKVITDAVQRSLPDGATLLGFSPEAVATATRRALRHATDWNDYAWELVHPGPLSPADAPRPRPGARRGGRRRSPRAHPALLGVEPAGRGHRQLPVGQERGRRRERRALRVPDRSAHQRRRRDVHGRRLGGDLLDLRPARAGAGDELRRQLRLLRRVGGHRAAQPRHRGDLPAAQRHREPQGQDRRRRAEAARQRRRAAPRDDGLRHGRRSHGRGAADRPREAQRQGHQVGEQARRPAAQPDRAEPRRDHRADGRDIPFAAWTDRR